MKKYFETELIINHSKLSLNHFMQETLANMMIGVSKTLKEIETSPQTIDLKIRKLKEPIDVDAHTYP